MLLKKATPEEQMMGRQMTSSIHAVSDADFTNCGANSMYQRRHQGANVELHHMLSSGLGNKMLGRQIFKLESNKL